MVGPARLERATNSLKGSVAPTYSAHLQYSTVSLGELGFSTLREVACSVRAPQRVPDSGAAESMATKREAKE